LGRPRDLVILASEISRHRRALDERALVRIVQECSAGVLAANTFDEMRAFLEVLRDRDKRDAFFALLPFDVLAADDVIAVWCAFHGVDRAYFDAYGRDADDVYHPFRELYECGLLGVVADDPTGESRVQRFRQPHEPVAGSRRELPRSRDYLLHPALRALLERLAAGGRFTAIRHVRIGHGEPWPRHWDLVVDVQRELLRRPHAAAEIREAALSLVERLATEIAGGTPVLAARRALGRSPAFARLADALERSGWDDLHLALLELFPSVTSAELEPTSPQTRARRPTSPSTQPTADDTDDSRKR
ncbi:MAG TPA: protein kinase, partial [Nannocystis sp.]